MKFVNLDSRPVTGATNTVVTHSTKPMYLDDFLDKTFITDYFLHRHTKSNDNISSSAS